MDYDLSMGGYYGTIQYVENTDVSATFTGMEEIGYCGNCGKEDSLEIIENPLIGCERCGHKS